MGNLLSSLLLLGILGVGVYGIVIFYYLLYGAGIVLYYQVAGAPAPAESCLSLSSVPAMLSSDTVFAYVRELPDEGKREAYSKILDSIKRLLMEVSKRPQVYPANKLTFVLGQLKSQITRSTIAGSLETVKFRKLTTEFIIAELVKEGV